MSTPSKTKTKTKSKTHFISLSVEIKMAEMSEQWEVEYARFFNFPSLSLSSSYSLSTITLLTESNRNRLHGTWLSSSSSLSSASVTLSADISLPDFVLSVFFLGNVHEEHYISKVNFTWPHVSCMSGFPPRGSRAVMVSYKDHLGQIQKFALRFSDVCQTEAFMATLKELMEFPKESFASKSNDNLVCGVSSQSGLIPSEEVDYSTEINTYQGIDELESSFTSDFDQKPNQLESSFTGEFAQKPILSQSTVLNRDVGGVLGGLPPSFMSLMTMSSQAVVEAAPILCSQADARLHLMKYLDNSSFQDIMGKVEEVMSEMGNNNMLM